MITPAVVVRSASLLRHMCRCSVRYRIEPRTCWLSVVFDAIRVRTCISVSGKANTVTVTTLHSESTRGYIRTLKNFRWQISEKKTLWVVTYAPEAGTEVYRVIFNRKTNACCARVDSTTLRQTWPVDRP